MPDADIPNTLTSDSLQTGKRKPVVSLIMGSQSDWPTMMHAHEILSEFDIAHESLVVSAHRTPRWLAEFASHAEERSLKAIIAGAGGAAHLPGMVAAQTTVPVFAVPIQSQALNGIDSLLSIVQMPAGIPVGTLAIGKPGAINAALLAIAVIALTDEAVRKNLIDYRQRQTESIIQNRSIEGLI